MTTVEEKYNGWVNWETWNAYNWLTSEESVYNSVRNAIKDASGHGVEWIRENAFLIVDMDDMTEDDRSKVDFAELYEAFAEDEVIGETAAAAVRTFIVRGGLTDRYYRRLTDALRATEGLLKASLECSKGCMLDAHQTDLLWAGWQALGAGEDCDIAAGISDGRFEYHLMCRLMPELDDIVAFIEGAE